MGIQVCIRSNNGVDSAQNAESLTEATLLAKKARSVSNHMVTIEVDGERTIRWDRDRVSGENRWRAVDADEFETLGKIREVARA